MLGRTGKGTYQCLGSRLGIKPGEAARLKVILSIPADFPHDEITYTKGIIWPRRSVKDKKSEDDRDVNTITIVGPKSPAAQPAPDLAVSKIAKQGRCVAGQPCSFAVTVRNVGAGPFTGPLTLTDTITPSTAQLTYGGPPPWVCRGKRSRITCTHPSTTVAAGASTSFALTFTTRSTSSGTLENCAAIIWPDASPVMAVQSALNALGFNSGTPDGKAGRQTRKAIRDYQKSVDLARTGRIDDTLVSRLLGSWSKGDANAANDRDCATAVLQAAEIPSAVQPAPSARPGLTQCTGGQIRNNRGQCRCPANKPVWTGQICKPRAAPRATCPSGWSRVNRNQAKAMARKGWQIKQIGNALCASKPQRQQRLTPGVQTPPQLKLIVPPMLKKN
jgi:hypothetical protein